MTSPLAWFATPRGRQASLIISGLASATTFCVYYTPHTFFLSKYKDIISVYQSGVPLKLPGSILKRWDRVLGEVNLQKHEKRLLEPFCVFGFEVYHAGSLKTRPGAIIGIPINYTYESTETVDPTPILVDNEPVNWNRDDAKSLLDSLILSDAAQSYGIAREILMSKHNEPMIAGGLSSFMMSTNYLLCRSMNNKFLLFEAPLVVRLVSYAFCSLLSFGVWCAQKDFYTCTIEQDTDIHLSQLGEKYQKGGVEFYDKQIKRNVALRSLLGVSGPNKYTVEGNEFYLWRQPNLPADMRKKYFEDALKGLNDTEANIEPIPAPA